MDTVEWYNKLRASISERKRLEKLENKKPRFPCCGYEVKFGHNKECVYYDPPNQPIRKNRFITHCPNAYSLEDDQMIGFDTLEELLEIDIVKRMSKIKDFYRYSLSDHHLMAEYDNGKRWWVIGTIRNKVELPKWEAGE